MKRTDSGWTSNSGNTIRAKNKNRSPELVVTETLAHHRSRYRYIGERGREYRTVYGIFRELNTRRRLTNAHTLWYAAVWYLVEHFYRVRRTAGDTDYLERIVEYTLCGDLNPLVLPKAIDTIDRFTTISANLGILLCRNDGIDTRYLEKTFTRLAELLEVLFSSVAGGKDDEVVYVLAVDAACGNLRKFAFQNIDVIPGPFFPMLESHEYDKKFTAVARRVERIDPHRYSGIDDFWNGIVP